MNVGDLITILVSLLAIVVSILTLKLNTFSTTKDGILRIRHIANILVKVIFLLMCIIIVFFLYLNQKENKKKQDVIEQRKILKKQEIDFEIQNGDYISAIQEIEEKLASLEDTELEEYIDYVLLEALCYNGLARESNQKKYYEYCINILTNRLPEEIYLEDIKVVEKYLLLYITYTELDSDKYSNELDYIIQYFCKGLENNNTYGVYYDDIVMYIGEYYIDKYLKYKDNEDLINAVDFYDSICNIALSENFWSSDSDQKFFKNYMAKCYYLYAKSIYKSNKDEADRYFDEAIMLFDDIITMCNIEKEKYRFFSCVLDQGDCYIFKNQNEKAYNNLTSFLYIDDEELDYLIERCRYYLDLDLSANDINIMIMRHNRLIKMYSESAQYEKAGQTMTGLLALYYKLSNQDDCTDFFVKGKEIFEEIQLKYYIFLSNEDKEIVDDLSDIYGS